MPYVPKEGDVLIRAVLRSFAEDAQRPTIEDVERAYIEAILCSTWNKAKACKILGISRKALYNKIHKYGLKNHFIRDGDGIQ